MIADLHIHTTFSDGLLTPEEVVDLAVKKELDGIAITDHDTTLGIDRAIERSKIYKDIQVIPGIEFSCIYTTEEIHILGYFIDYKSPDLIQLTYNLRLERMNRGYKILDKLNSLGINVTIDDVKKISGANNIGRPHIARALIKKGWVNSIDEAFDKYLEIGKAAYVERYKLSIEDAIDIIHRCKGIAVIAHPGLIKDKNIIYYCIKIGVDGIETVHSKHSKKEIEFYTKLANKHNLIKTGGSDCHGQLINGDYVLGKYCIDLDNLDQMKGLN
ncbi:PHP domain-containing protein [Sporanaerobacter acetigenes]|uniref:Polymerase/histidinol phosphatase N-terminal domain-containing protein n=1 Tax=Sporanaerobacter acetigenes DSM 13106 TaxID=1123281 RepID=A0A1M5XKN6_9FIRM|nr:PHP domain-containing protein [Sporanaerobacter acetigenes]SHI00407.1 hypothetical protein SAMN02745180_01720 [Sporanaerobacter acetigenes DSM 13106]